MATRFERQLEELHVQIITMGSLCEKVIALSAKAIQGEDCAREVFETDREIDGLEREIEAICMRLLLHQQPVARDLREISAALKMISDMERIGDLRQILQTFPSLLTEALWRFRMKLPEWRKKPFIW